MLIREVYIIPVSTVRKSLFLAYLGMASSSFAASCNARRRLASDLSVAMAEHPTPTARPFHYTPRKLRLLLHDSGRRSFVDTCKTEKYTVAQ